MIRGIFRFTAAFAFLFCFSSIAFSTPQDTTPVGTYGQLHVDGQFLKDQHGEKVILRGQSFGWSTWWPQYWNAEVVEWVTNDWKVDIVRAAMGVDTNPGYLNDSTQQSDLVRTVVNAAIENEIYVIIDWHAHGIHLDAALEFFTAMAKEYGEYPNIIYELFNEPVDVSWQDIKEYSDTLIKTIREYDSNNIIVVTPPNYAQDLEAVIDDPMEGHSNIMYSLHFYADGHKEHLRNMLQRGIDNELPIFVTESSGMHYDGDGPINYPEWWAYINLMEENNISWINWSISDKVETCSVLLPGASTSGGWDDDELNESGQFMRWLLRSYKVPTVRVDSIAIADPEEDIYLSVGDTYQVSASVFPDDATNSTIIWRSSSSNRASVSQDGIITAQEGGTAFIKAIAQDGGQTISVRVVVEDDETTHTQAQSVNNKLYPNPTTGVLSLNLEESFVGKNLSVYNSAGQNMRTIPIVSSEFVIDMSGYNAGIYFLSVGEKGSLLSQTIVKQ